MLTYQLRRKLNNPRGYDSLSLLEFCVNRLIHIMNNHGENFIEGNDAIKNHSQWANTIFGKGDLENQGYLSQVKDDFRLYFFDFQPAYSWNFERIIREHPNFIINNANAINIASLEGMMQALDDEINASKEDTRRNSYRISEIRWYSEKSNIFVATLDIEDDEEPKLLEDLPITIRIGGLTFNTKVLDFDKVGLILYFQLDYNILNYYGDKFVSSDTSWILGKIKNILCEDEQIVDLENKLISKFIENDVIPVKVENKIEGVHNYYKLDKSQQTAFKHSINHDVSLIWGPPGTGKSYTLRAIIDTLFKQNEKTLVVCIANVAVDSLLLKLVNLIEEQNINLKGGQILRAGYTRNKELLEREYLFPDNEETQKIRERILEITKILQNSQPGKYIELRQEKQILDEKLKDEVNGLIKKAKVIFATASKYFVDSILNTQDYDNLIIDEASMVSIPHFISLALNVNKRIIIAGDFRQLGPVVLSRSAYSFEWLIKDIFEFSGINPGNNKIEHPALCQLLIQRRFHRYICDIINTPFYQNLLETETIINEDEIDQILPYPGRIISYRNLPVGQNKAELTNAGSRKNEYSANEVLKILDQAVNPNYTIGIITPYRAQVRYLYEKIANRDYSKDIRKNIKVGTIHSFQGSEFDIVIIDTVDSYDQRIGKLYLFESGKRLINVAISRAKYKLIICGDLTVFTNGKGHNNIAPPVAYIFQRLIRSQIED